MKYDKKYLYYVYDDKAGNFYNEAVRKFFYEYILRNYIEDSSSWSNYFKLEISKINDSLIAIIKGEGNYNETNDDFKKYDCIKVFEKDNYIGYDDISQCTYFLYRDEINKFLKIEEKLCLYFIIFKGIINIYFYYNDYYKKKLPQYYAWVKDINTRLCMVREYKCNIKNTPLYSNDKIESINLFEEFKTFESTPEYYFIIRKRKDFFSKAILQLIYIEELIKSDKFHDARTYIENNDIFLYKNLKECLNDGYVKNGEYDVSKAKNSIINKIEMDYNLYKYDLYTITNKIDEIVIDNDFIENYINPILNFIINYLLLLKEEGKKDEVEVLISVLKIFSMNSKVEEFIMKWNYEKILTEISSLKVTKNENIEAAIEKINEKFEDAKLVDKLDEDSITEVYSHIDFSKLKPETPKFLATGEKILLIFNEKSNMQDYSCAVIEWGKAVELEVNNKLLNIIRNYKSDIQKELGYEKVKIGTTIGTFILICGMDERGEKYNKGYMKKYLYDKYYSKEYSNLDEKSYNDLVDNIKAVCEYRNSSAHKDKVFNYEDAVKCKKLILSSKKILDILSNLVRKKK